MSIAKSPGSRLCKTIFSLNAIFAICEPLFSDVNSAKGLSRLMHASGVEELPPLHSQSTST